MEILSYEYIRGLVEGEGCFTFCTRPKKLKDGGIIKEKVPTFVISMHERDGDLLRWVRNTLKLDNRVYIHNSSNKDGYKRGKRATLIIREFDSLRSIIVPLFYNKLHGHKRKQFDEWIEKIGTDPGVADLYQFIYRQHKRGFYNSNNFQFE